MKKFLLPSLKFTLIFMVLCAVLYPLFIAGVAKLSPGAGKGRTMSVHGRVVGYENIGQKFDEPQYFWGRPSAVNYNAAGSAGSNKGPSNPDYLKDVQVRMDSFLARNPGIRKEDIPSELVTCSGSGLDPDISVAGAKVQVKRIASVRKLHVDRINALVEAHVQKPFLGLLGPSKVNVLKLNIALDELR